METVFKNARRVFEAGPKIYDMLVAEKMRVQGFHYPFPANAAFVFWLDRETAGPYSPRP